MHFLFTKKIINHVANIQGDIVINLAHVITAEPSCTRDSVSRVTLTGFDEPVDVAMPYAELCEWLEG